MAPRGVSHDEKKKRMVEIFHETKDFYQLKELEKLGPKMKGIISQSVKEVVQELVDDGVIQTDKIGAGNFFWSFPSQEGANITSKIDDAKFDIERLAKKGEELQEKIEEERANREESDERTEALDRLRELRQQRERLLNERKDLLGCDAAQFEEKKRGVELSKEAAERWTENVVTTLQYLDHQGSEVGAIRNQFGIHEGWEDLA